VPVFLYTEIRGIDMYVHYNGNPCGLNIGDCVIRAISIVTGYSRHKVYAGLCLQGFPCTIWGNSNAVWADYLKALGFKRYTVYGKQTVAEFADRHPHGRYIIGTGNHAVAVVDGDIIDSWDSGQEIVQYYFVKER
jgi:hypothetical protein